MHHAKQLLLISQSSLCPQHRSPSLSLLVVQASEGSDGGGEATGEQFGCLSVVFWFSPQQCDDVLQAA